MFDSAPPSLNSHTSTMKNKGNTKHGAHGTLTYARWKGMMQRCSDEKHPSFKRYGAKGIGVCAKWSSFSEFLADMGECPSKEMTLDRIDNNIGYQPGNCRWATKSEQSLNRSMTVLLTHNGITKSVSEWAVDIGMPANSLHHRLYLGWSAEQALTRPLKSRRKS